MELLNFIAKRGAGNVFLTWVTVCSVKGTSSPYKNKYVRFKAYTTNIKLCWIFLRGQESRLLWEPHGAQLVAGHSLGSPCRRQQRDRPTISNPREKCCTNTVVILTMMTWCQRFQASQLFTYPPSTISSTARKSPSIFSNKALLSTFFLQNNKKYINVKLNFVDIRKIYREKFIEVL